jgi:hypothetical protein
LLRVLGHTKELGGKHPIIELVDWYELATSFVTTPLTANACCSR